MERPTAASAQPINSSAQSKSNRPMCPTPGRDGNVRRVAGEAAVAQPVLQDIQGAGHDIEHAWCTVPAEQAFEDAADAANTLVIAATATVTVTFRLMRLFQLAAQHIGVEIDGDDQAGAHSAADGNRHRID